MKYGTIPLVHATGGLKDSVRSFSAKREDMGGLDLLHLPYLHCSWHVFWVFSFLVLFIFYWGSAKNIQFFATIPRVDMMLWMVAKSISHHLTNHKNDSVPR